MAPSAVEALTTCETDDLRMIKKNLAWAGYPIKNHDDDFIETDFKQVDGYGTDKGSERIVVVREGNKARFRVRRRDESLTRVTSEVVKDKKGNTVSSRSDLVNTQNESDETYWQEQYAYYAARRRTICGS